MVFSPDEFIRRPASHEPEKIKVIENFERSSSSGVFRVAAFPETGEVRDMFPPAPVRDLRVTNVEDDIVTLRWTSPGDNMDYGNDNPERDGRVKSGHLRPQRHSMRRPLGSDIPRGDHWGPSVNTSGLLRQLGIMYDTNGRPAVPVPFKAGRISIEDDPRLGRPTFQRTDENVQKITDLIKENPRTTLLELEQDTGISKTTIGRIVTEDLRLKKTPAKFIPRFPTNEQKLCRLATCEDMLEMTRTDPEWKDKIITGDETWVYGYDPETKRQSVEWRGQGEPRPKKSRILKSRNKVLLVAFFENKGIVHHEYLPAGQTVIKEMYLSILRRLREAIRKKRPEKWTNGDWILHHDNARPHTAHLVTSFLAKNGTEILPQPPYSPDIAPNDFFLFPKLKAVLKGRHFDTREDIIEKSLLAFKSIPKEAYKNCFDNWEKRWRWCVEARGDYFEKF
ncbi:hypothetical protein LAZ67_13002976 [Cordylochernes scorpioides]|uniref:Transposase n=1 Tax=Cordylochernes scorpioides TaxID=51811 RepID=A0ABY6L5V4_9ARAC|nr:hypothetical protein LAZ67_13002976 [Cordylochernes scorpioides]